MEKEKALNEWEQAKSDLSNNTLTLTEQEAHCVALMCHSVLFKPNESFFCECRNCTFNESCTKPCKLSDGEKYISKLILNGLRDKLTGFTGIDLGWGPKRAIQHED